MAGFNWGVKKELLANDGKGRCGQVEYPLSNFEGNCYELGSLKRVIPLLYEYYPRALAGMQSNYCFFRSERENQITNKDLELSQDLLSSILIIQNHQLLFPFRVGQRPTWKVIAF